MAIVQTSDFVGEYKVSTSRFTELDLYITKYEKYYLVRLLGADLYALFIADLTAPTPQVPQTARFIAIFNPFNQIPTLNAGPTISEGIKKMLVMFIYFHYVRDSSSFNTIAGQVNSSNENSVNTPYNGFNLVESYNTAIDTYSNIQYYIVQNQTTYPETNTSLFEYLCYTSGI